MKKTLKQIGMGLAYSVVPLALVLGGLLIGTGVHEGPAVLMIALAVLLYWDQLRH